MYEEFTVADRWSGEPLHCSWRANISAIATRHADAIDVRFDVNGRSLWIALPGAAWVEQKRRTGCALTDQLAAQIAGRALRQRLEEGFDSGRDFYTMSVEEALAHLESIVDEARAQGALPTLPAGV